MTFSSTTKRPSRSVIIEKKGKRSIPKPIPAVTAGHELTVKFSELPKPKIGEREIHDITIKLNDLPFYVKTSLRKKQWNKLKKAVDAVENSWIAAGRGRIQKIDRRVIYLENVGFQVYERKPKA
jgi:hypothetical protein